MALTDIPFRIRLGVTGHRTLTEPGRVAEAIRVALKSRAWELFDRPLAPKRRTEALAYTVLTPLAEGADRLVAKEVLDTPDAEIEVVLPLTREDYLGDFAEEASRAEFEVLSRRARRVHALRTSPLASGGPAAALEDERKRAYEDAGRHVVDHCDVLLAVWDGQPSRGRGGTAEIVSYAREKKKPLIIVPAQDPGSVIAEKGAGLSGRTYERIGAFNRFPIPEKERQASIDKMYEGLFATPEGRKVADRAKALVRDGLLPWYVRASSIAKRSQKRYLQAGWTVYALSPLAVAAVAVGVLIPAWAPAAFLFEWFLLLVIYGVIRLADRRRVHRRWVETRFLVERIRGAIFLLSCGVAPVSVSLSPFAKPDGPADDWTVRVFAEIMSRLGRVGPGDRSAWADGVAFVRARWIGAQIGFHAAKAEKAGRLSRLFEKAGRATFLAAIGASALHLVSLGLGHRGFVPALDKPVIFLAMVLPAVGAAVGGLRSHREYSRLEKQSQSMEAALRELDQRFAAVADLDGLEGLLRETEKLMAEETRDWLALMKFAKVEAI